MTEIRPLDPARFDEARALLEEAALPVADLRPAALPEFFAAWDEGHLVGVVAVEPLGREGLLRSLAVRPESRGRGTGRRLVAVAEAHARERGMQALYLLTTTAEGFFSRAGYRRVSRAEAPDSVRGTAEFRTVCPATATLMGKRVG